MNIPLDRVGLLEDGIYKLRVKETEDRTSAAGNPYVNLTCEVLDNNGRPTETTLWNTLTMTPKAKFMVSKFLDAIQAPAEGSISSRSLRGKTFWAKVGRQTYEGKTKNVIDDYLTPEQAKKDPDTIQNVFNASFADDEPSNGKGFNDNGPESWDEEDDNSPVQNLPDEMTEDTAF